MTDSDDELAIFGRGITAGRDRRNISATPPRTGPEHRPRWPRAARNNRRCGSPFESDGCASSAAFGRLWTPAISDRRFHGANRRCAAARSEGLLGEAVLAQDLLRMCARSNLPVGPFESGVVDDRSARFPCRLWRGPSAGACSSSAASVTSCARLADRGHMHALPHW